MKNKVLIVGLIALVAALVGGVLAHVLPRNDLGLEKLMAAYCSAHGYTQVYRENDEWTCASVLEQRVINLLKKDIQKEDGDEIFYWDAKDGSMKQKTIGNNSGLTLSDVGKNDYTVIPQTEVWRVCKTIGKRFYCMEKKIE